MAAIILLHITIKIINAYAGDMPNSSTAKTKTFIVLGIIVLIIMLDGLHRVCRPYAYLFDLHLAQRQHGTFYTLTCT